MEPLLTTEDVSGWLQVDVVTVRRLITKGELPAYRVGGEYRFKKQEIEEYLERQRVPVRGESGSPFRKMKTLVEKGFIHSPVQDAFQRFTSRARSVLSLAQEEAERLHHSYVGTEHLLLALLREGEGVGGIALRNLGVELEDAQRRVEEVVGRGSDGTHQPEPGLGMTPRVKRVLELARDEAQRLEHRYIGTEHLLLGIVEEGEGVAARILRSLGADAEKIRSEIHRLLTTRV